MEIATATAALARARKRGKLPLRAELPTSEGKAPSEFRILRVGVNDSDYGPLLWDALSSALVFEARRKKGSNPLNFDFNHGQACPYPTAEQAKSAGTFEIEDRAGELWAVSCAWTDEARERIERREYLLFSPLVLWFDDMEGQRRPFELKNVALVNMAGLDNLTPLAASAWLLEDDPMLTPEEITALQNRAATQATEIHRLTTELAAARAEATAARTAAAGAGGGSLALTTTLGLPVEATVQAQVSAVSGLVALRGRLLTETGAADVDAAMGAIKAWKDSHGRVAEIQSGEEKRVAAANVLELKTLLDGAVKDLKIPPAKRPAWESRYQKTETDSNGQQRVVVTSEGLAELRGTLDVMVPVVAGASSTPTGGGGAGSSALTAEEMAHAKRHNLNPKIMEQQKARLMEEQAARTRG